MYTLNDIFDRAFTNWSNLLGADNRDFWHANSAVEAKPTTEQEPVVPTEIPVWEQPADTADTTEGCTETRWREGETAY